MGRRDVIARTTEMVPPGKCVDVRTGHGGYARLASDFGWPVEVPT